MPHPDPAGDAIEARLTEIRAYFGRGETFFKDTKEGTALSNARRVIGELVSMADDLLVELKYVDKQLDEHIDKYEAELRLARAVVKAVQGYVDRIGYMLKQPYKAPIKPVMDALAAYRAAFPATEGTAQGENA